MNITDAIYEKMAGDATLVALLASYDGVSPAVPAIFTAKTVPEDAARPYVWSYGNMADVHFDEIADNRGRDVLRDIFCVVDADGSAASVETLAERVRALFHRQPLTIVGGVHTMTICIGGPVPAPTDDSLDGRVLTLRIVAMEA